MCNVTHEVEQLRARIAELEGIVERLREGLQTFADNGPNMDARQYARAILADTAENK